MVEAGTDVIGFGIEALDGHIGKVGAVTHDAQRDCLVVRCGVLRHKHVIPARAVVGVDARRHRVMVKMTKHQIVEAPTTVEEPTTPRPESAFGTAIDACLGVGVAIGAIGTLVVYMVLVIGAVMSGA